MKKISKSDFFYSSNKFIFLTPTEKIFYKSSTLSVLTSSTALANLFGK